MTRDLGPGTDQGQRTDEEQRTKHQGPGRAATLSTAFSSTARSRTAPLALALAWTTGAALPWSIAVALSVRTTAAALTRTTLPAESGRTLTRRLAAAVCLPSGTMATMTLAAVTIRIAIRIEPSAARAEREVRRLALGNMPLGSRQLCTNQRAMDGPIVAFIAAGRSLIDRVGLAHRVDGRLRRRSQLNRLL